MFIKYQHIERYGGDETDRIDLGVCYVFPKLDGTNASIWYDQEKGLCAGSRTRQLHSEGDNAGFYAWVLQNKERFSPFFKMFPDQRLYGEWMVPHTLKTYREDVWRRFWIFDITTNDNEGNASHIPYENYASRLRSFGLDYIEPLCKISDPTREQLDRVVASNTFLIQDGSGAGEGIVIKNYDYTNKQGEQKWAKLVRNEFKESNRREFGIPELNGKKQVEGEIAGLLVTKAFVDKTRAKINLAYADGHNAVTGTGLPCVTIPRSQMIPRLLETIYHDLVVEEIWDIVKKYKNPTIDFRRLRAHVVNRTKKHAEDLF